MSLRAGKSLYVQAVAAYMMATAERETKPQPQFWIDEFSNLDFKMLAPLVMAARNRGYSSFLPVLMTEVRKTDWHMIPFAQMPWSVAQSLRGLIPEPQMSRRSALLASTTHTPLPDDRELRKNLRHRAAYGG